MIHKPRRKRRFTITLEGYTRYISDYQDAADVTLLLPPRGGDEPREYALPGGLPLSALTFLPSAGDQITDIAQLDALPPWSIVKNNSATGLVAQKKSDGQEWHTIYGPVAPQSIVGWRDGAVVLFVPATEEAEDQ